MGSDFVKSAMITLDFVQRAKTVGIIGCGAIAAYTSFVSNVNIAVGELSDHPKADVVEIVTINVSSFEICTSMKCILLVTPGATNVTSGSVKSFKFQSLISPAFCVHVITLKGEFFKNFIPVVCA